MAILPIKATKTIVNPEVLTEYIKQGRTAMASLAYPIQPNDLILLMSCLSPNCFVVNTFREGNVMFFFICSPLFDRSAPDADYRKALMTYRNNEGMIIDAWLDVPCDNYTLRMRAQRVEFVDV